jgi:N12 class adenine-specific DNA methylase
MSLSNSELSTSTYELESGQAGWFFGEEEEKQSFIQSHNKDKRRKVKILTPACDFFNAPLYAEKSAAKRYHNSINAIKTLNLIESANRYAIEDEQAALSKFSSFASMPQIFDEENTKFAKKRSELKALVSDEEYNSLRHATLSAFYTPEILIDGLKGAIAKSGFKNGNIIDPASGTGALMRCFDQETYLDSNVTMIELEPLSSRINYALYPHANLYQGQGFETVDIENDSQDIITSNPPFGEKRIIDLDRPHLNGLTLHNYFMNRSIDCLKEGGLFYAIVSTSFLDAKNDKNRASIAKQATLLHAIRLPKAVFEKTTGANATVDILLFTKDNKADQNPAWLTSSTQTCTVSGEDYFLNDYFSQNPQFMLGEMQVQGTFQGNNVHCIYTEKDIDSKVSDLFNTFPSNCFNVKKTKAVKVEADVSVTVHAHNIKNPLELLHTGAYVFDNLNNLHTLTKKRNGDMSFTPVKSAKDKIKARISGMASIRDALIALLHAEKNDITHDLDNLRAKLNTTYDNFVKKLGYVSQGANQRAFKFDPFNANLTALEVNFKDAKTGKSNKVVACVASAEKAPIFTQRVISPYVAPTSAKNATDALHITLNHKGRVDIPHIASLINDSEENVINELSNQIFLVPNRIEHYETTNIYLSGDVKTKLDEAKLAAKTNSTFDKNVAALENVIPLDIQAQDISIRCHSAWLPTDIIKEFIGTLLGDNARPEISYGMGKWYLKINGFIPTKINKNELGTKDFPASKVVQNLYMGKDLVVRLPDGDGGYIIDHEQTLLVQAAVETIHTKFKEWIFSDHKRTVLLSKLYNEKFNRDVVTNYDASFLTLPTLNKNVTPYKHQKRAIYRAITTGHILADVPVGGGKSLILCAISEEWIRLGLKKRVLIVSPNHLVNQLASEYIRLFPQAKILCLSPSELNAQKREETLLRLKTGSANIIIVPESTLKKLPIPQAYEEKFIQEDIDEIITAKESLKKGSFSIKKLETMQENLKFKLTMLANSHSKNDEVNLEALGIDAIMYDEAHQLKNLFYNSDLLRKCAGLNSPSGSQKAYDFYLKTRYLTEKNPESRGIVLATGTVLSNSIIELHAMKRYMMLPELKKQNIAYLDQWVGLFAAATDEFELSATGRGFKLNQRLRQFTNIPELIRIYHKCAEVVSEEDLEEFLPKLPCGSPARPPMRGGVAQTTYLEPDSLQEQFMDWLVYRASDLKNSSVCNDNMLSVMYCARASSLDLRMLNNSLPANPNRKAVAIADRVTKLYNEFDEQKGTQIIFCDLSVPKKHIESLKQKIELLERIVDADNSDSEQAQLELDKIGLDQRLAVHSNFDVYNDIKSLLIMRGIKPEEIVFAQDYKTQQEKAELYNGLNTGEFRVAIASTHALGTGANVNKRLVGIQLADPVFRPSDNTQRCGRGLRIGNEIYQNDPMNFKGMDIRFYATKRSLDSFLFQMLSSKAKFISSFRSASMANASRIIKDIGADVVTFEELKTMTTGNPLIKDHFEMKRKVQLLNLKFDQFQQTQINALAIEERAKKQIDTTQKRLGWCKMDFDVLKQNVRPQKSFLLTDHNGNKLIEHGKAAIYISDLIFNRAKDAQKLFLASPPLVLPTFTYNGFDIEIELFANKVAISMIGKLTYSFERSYENVSASGIIMVLNNYAKSFQSMFIAPYEETLRHAESELKGIKDVKTFKQLDELNQSKKDLKELTLQLAKTESEATNSFVPPPFLMKGLTEDGIASIVNN